MTRRLTEHEDPMTWFEDALHRVEDTPWLVVDEARTRANIERVAQATRAAGKDLLPHAKTPADADEAARLRSATRYVDLVSDSIDTGSTGSPIVAYVREHLGRTEGLEDPVTVGRFIASNYFDGFHTAGVAVASTLKYLLDSPESLRAVREDPRLVPAAFQEDPRLATPVMVSTRLTSADVVHDGTRIPAAPRWRWSGRPATATPICSPTPTSTTCTGRPGWARRSGAGSTSVPGGTSPGCWPRPPSLPSWTRR